MSPDDLFSRLNKKKKPKPEEPSSRAVDAGPEVDPKSPPARRVERHADDDAPADRKQPAQQTAERQRQLAESLLDNEALTEDLDDPAAQALIDWGMALAQRVAESTQDLPEDQAQAQVEQGGQAMRSLMRTARALAIQPAEDAAQSTRDLPPALPEGEGAEAAAPERSRGAGEAPGTTAADKTADLLAEAARYAGEIYGQAVQPAEVNALLADLRQAGDTPVERIARLRGRLEGAADSPPPAGRRSQTTQHMEEEDRDR